VLCFVESRNATMSDRHKMEVQSFAKQQYRVSMKHVVVWSPDMTGAPLVPQHMVYFMHAICRAIRYVSVSVGQSVRRMDAIINISPVTRAITKSADTVSRCKRAFS